MPRGLDLWVGDPEMVPATPRKLGSRALWPGVPHRAVEAASRSRPGLGLTGTPRCDPSVLSSARRVVTPVSAAARRSRLTPLGFRPT
eukprot:10508409-Heterocapsa_arctica.AAC.1